MDSHKSKGEMNCQTSTHDPWAVVCTGFQRKSLRFFLFSVHSPKEDFLHSIEIRRMSWGCHQDVFSVETGDIWCHLVTLTSVRCLCFYDISEFDFWREGTMISHHPNLSSGNELAVLNLKDNLNIYSSIEF